MSDAILDVQGLQHQFATARTDGWQDLPGLVRNDQEIAALSKRKSEIARAAISEQNPIAPDCIAVFAGRSVRRFAECEQ